VPTQMTPQYENTVFRHIIQSQSDEIERLEEALRLTLTHCAPTILDVARFPDNPFREDTWQYHVYETVHRNREQAA
jgi:hypothetical protein